MRRTLVAHPFVSSVPVPRELLAAASPPVELSLPLEAGLAAGGGWIARVRGDRGVSGLWRGRDEWELPPGLAVPARRDQAAVELRLFPGGWLRSLSGRGEELELGLLAEVADGLTLVRGSVGELARGEGSAVALLTPGSDVEGMLARLGPLGARIRSSLARGARPGPDELSIDLALRADPDGHAPPASDPSPSGKLAAALRCLDDALLPGAPGAEGEPLFLAGLGGDGPEFLGDDGVVEVGLAALCAGRTALARAALTSLFRTGNRPADHSPAGRLLLAAKWALWTGRAEELLSWRPELERSAEELEGLGEELPPGASFPPAHRILHLLAEGVEPLGAPGWHEALAASAARLRTAADPPRRTLPVIGAAAAPSPDPAPLPSRPSLPTPQAFASPDDPGFMARRTLHAARLVRSWVEGVLGLEPDAAYGRATLAPRLHPEWRRFSAEGLLVGDAPLRLDYRLEGGIHTFVLAQTGGRVPMNLVFEPFLPLKSGASDVPDVRIGDAPAAVEATVEEGGVRLRCQFPLDPERKVTVVGDP